jgi:hypothetical protein
LEIDLQAVSKPFATRAGAIKAMQSILRDLASEMRGSLATVDWRVFWILPAVALFLMASPWIPGMAFLGDKKLQEGAALMLAGGMFTAFLAAAVHLRTEFSRVLVLVGGAFLVREIHFDGADIVMLAMLLAAAVWTWTGRARMRPSLRDGRQVTWLVLAVATYVFSQFCARRGFQFLPNQRVFHEAMEEGSENLAHLTMVVAALRGRRSAGDS